MVRKKIDNRIRTLIENCVASNYRSFFVIVGDKGRDQVVILHHMLSKATVKSRPSVLWCYKKELGFSTHRKKRMRQLQKKIKSGKLDVNEDDPFELFIAATNIRYCYYSETHKILGNTYGMLVLQDFEALTPNLLARSIETIEGGGIIVILLRSMTSLKQLYAMSMDVHDRYRTESHNDVVGRFNERFILSLATCKKCLVVDDQLTILPLSSHSLTIIPMLKDETSVKNNELQALKENLQNKEPFGVIVNCCQTLDQAKAVLKFIDCLLEKTLQSTMVLTSARGRGKSAALGLAISSAVAFSYSNIFVTSPSPENLKTLFEFILKGFDALDYQEHIHYEVIQSVNPDLNKSIVRINVFQKHRQTIQYIHPSDANQLGQAELVVIDEAAAIPLPLVKSLLGSYVVFMASTINGYEGTGRSLSLKLISQLRQQTSLFQSPSEKDKFNVTTGRSLHEMSLIESIRYKNGDDVEAWLNQLLCLDAKEAPQLSSGCPSPEVCQLFYINRDTLFSYHSAAETFLQRLVSLFVASHYKNSPNDLQMMSDAPAHHLFCLLPPVDPNSRSLPEILCVIQICLEGGISKDSVLINLSRGKRAAGDLIPWTISQQFQDEDFASLSGARVVRIATHPDHQRMGYGKQALQLLKDYYEKKISSLDEDVSSCDKESTFETSHETGLYKEQIAPKKSLSPLLLKLTERIPEKLDYLGVAYGLTPDLLRFWKKSGFVPLYLRQTANDLTGEHSCIMIKPLNHDSSPKECNWLEAFHHDFRRRFVNLLSYQFKEFHSSLALNILQNQEQSKDLTKQEFEIHLSTYDLKRLEMYSKNLIDYHLIMDLLPVISRLYFLKKLGDVSLSGVQSAILLSLGLQHKTVDDVSKELQLPSTQILGLFNRTVRRLTQYLTSVVEKDVESMLIPQKRNISMEPSIQTLEEDLEQAASKIRNQQREELKKLKEVDFSEFAIKGSEEDWQSALTNGSKTLVSIKNIQKSHDEPAKKKMKKSFKKKSKR